ncbi:MAG: response regulator [Desulfobacteraceae bacterium]|nr:response regulator [Desulfobacteraceae bacterium]
MDNINKDMKILIVDDSMSMRRIVIKFLKNNGFQNCIEAKDGVEALDIVQNDPIDFIVSDLNMPNMNGLEFLKIVKHDSHTKHIPFIMLTVEAIQKTMIKAVTLKVDSYIVKPITEKIFIDEMIRVLTEINE